MRCVIHTFSKENFCKKNNRIMFRNQKWCYSAYFPQLFFNNWNLSMKSTSNSRFSVISRQKLQSTNKIPIYSLVNVLTQHKNQLVSVFETRKKTNNLVKKTTMFSTEKKSSFPLFAAVFALLLHYQPTRASIIY